jgi:hypothetical protein
MFKLFKRLALIYILIFLLLVVLIAHSFRPEVVNVDRYSIILFGFLFIVAILPSLQSGKISYFFEFKRDLDKARESVNDLKKAAEVGQEAIANVKKEADQNIISSNACQTCGWLRQKIYNSLKEINKKSPKKSKARKPLTLLEDLNNHEMLDPKMYQAAKDVLKLCDPDNPYDQMDEEDSLKITKVALPLIEYLESYK